MKGVLPYRRICKSTRWLVLFLFTTTIGMAQISVETGTGHRLLGTAGYEGDFPGGGNISWTVGEVIVFSNDNLTFPIMSGMQSYPTCSQPSTLTVNGTSSNLCGSVPVSLSISGNYASYQWYLNGGKIVGATKNSYAPVINGQYSAVVKLIGGFCTFSTTSFTVTLANGVNKPIITNLNNADTLLVSSSGASYEWYVDNRRIVGETNQNYRTLFNGNYQVKVRYPGGCMLISDVVTINKSSYDPILKSNAVITDSTIFFPEFESKPSVRVHPNPTSDFVYIEYHSSNSQIPSLQVLNQEGKVLLDNIIPTVQRTYKRFEVDLSIFPKAVYFLKLVEGDYVTVEKVVKL